MDFFTSAQQAALSLIGQAMSLVKRQGKPTIILGFSGGPDSMFLLHLLHSLEKNGSITLVAAHLDHQWRAESHSELLFCQEVCQNLGVRFCPGKAEDFMHGLKRNGSQEEFGRTLRRAFLQKVMQEEGALCIALAHHLQDQQETFFIRLLRGTTLNGLTGIKPIDGSYIRPLLTFNKEDLLTYMHDNMIAYLTDPSNTSPAFLRNRLRTSVMPMLNQVDQRFNAKFSTTLQSLVEEDEYVTTRAQEAFEKCFSKSDKNVQCIGDLVVFNALHPVLKRRVVLKWLIHSRVCFSPSASFIQEIIRFLFSPCGGSHCIASGHQVIKKKKNFWISQINRC